mgnify:CR=1 FL=1
MTSNQSHKAVVFGSVSIDKIVNKHGSFSDILGGSAAYALLANKKNSCELVGVVGDERRYSEVIALRAVETVDFMTANWAFLPHEFLDKVSRRIVNEIEDVSRVVYDISGKPPATIEWE